LLLAMQPEGDTQMRFSPVALVCAIAAAGSCGDVVDARVADAFNTPAATATDIVQSVIDSGAAPAFYRIERWNNKTDLGLDAVVNEANRFVGLPGVVAVVGHAGSRESIAAASIYNRAGVPQVVPMATSSRLADVGGWTFRLAPSDVAEGAFIANYAIDSLGAQRIAVLYIADEYGTGLRDGVASQLEARGYPVRDHAAIPRRGCAHPGTRDALRLIIAAAMRRADPEVVVLAIGESSAPCIVRAVFEARPSVRIITADGVTMTSQNIRALPEAYRSRLQGVSFWAPRSDAVTQSFVARARRVLKREPNASDALMYDAHMLLAAALKEAGPNRAAVRRWLESLGRTRPPWKGVTGDISFEADRVHLLRMASAAAPE
jgi:branched-chain amino acid transport system substrate-binding protein